MFEDWRRKKAKKGNTNLENKNPFDCLIIMTCEYVELESSIQRQGNQAVVEEPNSS